jgi:hypothetical protein
LAVQYSADLQVLAYNRNQATTSAVLTIAYTKLKTRSQSGNWHDAQVLMAAYLKEINTGIRLWVSQLEGLVFILVCDMNILTSFKYFFESSYALYLDNVTLRSRVVFSLRHWWMNKNVRSKYLLCLVEHIYPPQNQKTYVPGFSQKQKHGH